MSVCAFSCRDFITARYDGAGDGCLLSASRRSVSRGAGAGVGGLLFFTYVNLSVALLREGA